MPRANRRRDQAPRGRADIESLLTVMEHTESQPDGDYRVRNVRGTDTGKVYVCPGCQQQVSAAVPHVVAWPADGLVGLEGRRHWHTPCWRARARRAPRGSWK